MAKRHFNWIAAIVLVIALAVLAVTAFTLRKWQRTRMAYTAREAGLKAYENHIWEDTTNNLGRYLAVNPGDIQIMFKYAEAQLNIRPLKRGNIQQAIAAYRSILRLDKKNPVAAEKLVGLYLQMNIAAEAELIAERYLQTSKAPKISRMLAISLARQRKFTEAAALLQTIIKEHPEQVLAYETLGQLAEQYPEDFPATPEHWFNEAIKNNPSSALAFIIRAAFHLKNHEVTKALADLEKAEQLDLSDSVIRLRLATEFGKANAFEKARIHLVEIQAQDSASQALWQTWVMLALKTMSKEEMLKVAQTGLKELASQPWDFMPIAVELFIRCGEFDRARGCLDKLKQKDIAPPTVAFLEGLLANAEKQNHKAIHYWRQAKQLGDKSEKTQLALAKAYSRAGDNQSAILQLRMLVSEHPYLFQAHLELARLLSQTGNWSEAAEQVHSAMQIAPNNPDVAVLYIQARMKLVESHQTDRNAQIWQEVEKQLAKLENFAGNTFEVKLLRFQLAMKRKQYTNAEQLLMTLKADNHSRAEVVIAEIDLLTAQGRVDEAISKLYVLTERFPKAVLPVKYLAALLARHNSRENCQKVLKDAMQRIEEPIAKRELGILLVDFYAQWGQNDKSYQLLTELSQELPYDIPIKHQLLKCQQVTKDLNQAQQLVDDIKAIEGEDGWQWRCEQANIWFAGKNFKDHYPQIIALLKENLTANPYDQTSRILLAAAYEKAGELQLAITTYSDALNRSPEDVRIIVPTVAALHKAKEYEQADEILNRAAKQELTHSQISKLQLQSYLRQGKLSPAESILEDLLAKNTNNQNILLSLALLNMRQNKYEQARELLSKLKAQQPKSLLVTAALVELNVRQKNSDQALALCNEMVKQFGNASTHILRGKTYAMLGQNNLAKEDFERATSIEPDNIQAWILKSDFNQSIGQSDEAFKNIQKALLLDPGNILVQKRTIAFLLSSNEPDKIHQGRELLDKALSLNPQDVELRLYKARSLLAKGTAPSIEKAAQILQKITEDQPKNADAWVLLGELALKQEQFGRAVDIALRGLVHRLNDKALLMLKAQAEAARAPALAVPTLKLLYELDPNDTDTGVLLASTYIAADEPEKAVNLLRKQLSTCDVTTRRKCNIALAVALYKNGNKEDAEKWFESLSQSAPEDPAPLLAQAELFKNDKLFSQLSQKVIHWCQNHPEDNHTPIAIAGNLAASKDREAKKTAENLLRTILDRDPNCLPAMNTLAVLLQTTGRPVAAARLYNQILELEPDNVIAINNLAWIMCEEQQKYEQAVELAQRGLEKAPNYIDLIDTRGVAYYRLGEFNKAVQDFNQCIKLYPARTPSAVASYFHLGRALASLGQKDEAIESLKKTLDLNVKIGGLSPADVAEAQRLLQELSRGD